MRKPNHIQLPEKFRKKIDLKEYLPKDVILTQYELSEIQEQVNKALKDLISEDSIFGWRAAAHEKLASQLRLARKTLAQKAAGSSSDATDKSNTETQDTNKSPTGEKPRNTETSLTETTHTNTDETIGEKANDPSKTATLEGSDGVKSAVKPKKGTGDD